MTDNEEELELAQKIAKNHNPTVLWHEWASRSQEAFLRRARTTLKLQALAKAYGDTEADLAFSEVYENPHVIEADERARDAAWIEFTTELEKYL